MAGEDIQLLHEEASAHYLQGNYEAALEAWRELLALDPQDDQAREGIRLCEQLAAETARVEAGQSGSAAVDVGPLDFGMLEDEPLSAGDDPTSFFSELSAELLDEEPVLPPPTAAAPRFPEPALAPISDSLRDSLHGLDSGMGASAREMAPPSTDFPAGAFELPDLEAAGMELDEEFIEVSSDGEEAAAVAEKELRHRVNELMASALAAMEQGQRDEALSVLSRVLILDEFNEAATALREKILRPKETQPKQPPPPPVEPETLQLEPPQRTEAKPREEIVHLVEKPYAEKPQVKAEPRRKGAFAPPPATFEMPEPLPAGKPDPVKPPAKGSTAQQWIAQRRIWVLAGAAALLLIVVALGARWMFAGPQHPPAEAAANPADAAAVPRRSKPEPQGAAAAVTPAPGGSLEEILRRAQQAFDSSDYAEAVVLYNQALLLAPQDTVVQQKLLAAGNRYREARQLEAQWKEAIDSFQNSDYRNTLQLLYRLPKTEDPGKVERYISNAWFNLGLQALESRACQDALSHFKEAEAARPRDAKIQSALRLAKSCAQEGDTTSFIVAIEALEARRLED